MGIQRCKVEGIAGQEYPVVAVQQADGVGRMPRRAQDFELPPAQVDDIAFVDEMTDRERAAAEILRNESLGQRLPDPTLLEELGNGRRRAAGRPALRVLGVAPLDRLELVVAADVVVVRV